MKFIFTVLLALCSSSVFAQSVILTVDGKQVPVTDVTITVKTTNQPAPVKPTLPPDPVVVVPPPPVQSENCQSQGNVVCGAKLNLMKPERVFNLPFTAAIIPAGSYSSLDTADQFKTVFRREFTTTGSTTAAGTISVQFENGLIQRYSIKTANPAAAPDVSTNPKCSKASAQSVTIAWTTRSNIRSYCVLQPNTTYFLDIAVINYNKRFTRELGNNIASNTPLVEKVYVEERQLQSQ